MRVKSLHPTRKCDTFQPKMMDGQAAKKLSLSHRSTQFFSSTKFYFTDKSIVFFSKGPVPTKAGKYWRTQIKFQRLHLERSCAQSLVR